MPGTRSGMTVAEGAENQRPKPALPRTDFKAISFPSTLPSSSG